jgi:hypothetical protein
MDRIPGDEREDWYNSLGRPLDVQSKLVVADDQFDDSFDQISGYN